MRHRYVFFFPESSSYSGPQAQPLRVHCSQLASNFNLPPGSDCFLQAQQPSSLLIASLVASAIFWARRPSHVYVIMIHHVMGRQTGSPGSPQRLSSLNSASQLIEDSTRGITSHVRTRPRGLQISTMSRAHSRSAERLSWQKRLAAKRETRCQCYDTCVSLPPVLSLKFHLLITVT